MNNKHRLIAIVLCSIVTIITAWKFVSKEKYVKLQVEAKFDKPPQDSLDLIFDDVSSIKKICKDSVIDARLIDTIPFIVDDPKSILYYVTEDAQSYILKDLNDSTCCKGPVIPKGTVISLHAKHFNSGLNPFDFHGAKVWIFDKQTKFLSGDIFNYDAEMVSQK